MSFKFNPFTGTLDIVNPDAEAFDEDKILTGQYWIRLEQEPGTVYESEAVSLVVISNEGNIILEL